MSSTDSTNNGSTTNSNSTDSDFAFDNGEWVLVDAVTHPPSIGIITGTAFFDDMQDAYQVQFCDGSSRWLFEDMISKTTKH